MNNKIKKISCVALFSTILSVGVGIVPIMENQTIVHAEESEYGYKDELANAKKSSTTVFKDMFITSVNGISLAREGHNLYEIGQNAYNYYKNGNEQKTFVPMEFFDGNHYTPAGEEVVPNYIQSVGHNNVVVNTKGANKISVESNLIDTYNIGKSKDFSTKSPEIQKMMVGLIASVNSDFDTTNLKAENMKVTYDDETKTLKISYDLSIPKDSEYLTLGVPYESELIKRKINRNTTNFSQLKNDLESKDDAQVFSYSMTVEKDNDTLMDNYTINALNLYTEHETFAKMVNRTQESLSLPMLFTDEGEFLNVKYDKQSVNANVLNGGITGGIVSTDVEKDLSVEDIDFGELHIGQKIDPIEKDKMISVRDWTGGSGWKLTAKQKDSDRNTSLQLGVNVNNENNVSLNDEDSLITKGEAQLETITKDGKYSAEWGTHPKKGDFNNVIEWSLTANVTE